MRRLMRRGMPVVRKGRRGARPTGVAGVRGEGTAACVARFSSAARGWGGVGSFQCQAAAGCRCLGTVASRMCRSGVCSLHRV